MSVARIERLLKESLNHLIPVPRPEIKYTVQAPLSKRLRRFDNTRIIVPDLNMSGVYINTNESGVMDTAVALAKFPKIKQGCHIGFSGWHNFDIMAQRRSSIALICDLNPENALFLSTALKYVCACSDRFQFIEEFTKFVKKHNYIGLRSNQDRDPWMGVVSPLSIKFCFNVVDEYPYTDHYSVIEEVDLELYRETSWLYTDERYEYIKKLALMDKIALITENICSSDVFRHIVQILHFNTIQIDTVYLSNIAEWIDDKKDRDLFLETIQSFSTDIETILIDGRVDLLSDSRAPRQRCISFGELNKRNLSDWFFQPEEKAIEPEIVSADCAERITRMPL
ncbi:hypothetical protein [Legionella quateirensis]|uniref:DUF7790 domain-containing protein n=1 Tax=Legionella quateirensis TaxID=45072 RepID=A0A378KX59_9GAMM|nr:hypothetical protein [Legionella quateirensis]KTD50807.1 hypothetical protein Lqua_1034 [Legionella quateirensis]STY17948.1 Uncharacterised protein [Legionella quateirensis]